MKKMLAVAGLFASLSVAFLVGKQSSASHVPSQQEAVPVSGSASESPIAASQHQPEHLAQIGQPNEKLLADYECRMLKDSCLRELNFSNSEAESLWLFRNGYPSATYLEELKSLPDGELMARSSKGDLAAKAVLGARLVAAGQEKEGKATLFDALVHGSVYASYEMGKAASKKSLTEGAAYYRLAYLLGDWKSSGQMYRDFPELDSVEWNIADIRAMSIYNNLLQYKGSRRLPLRIQPRPNQ